MRPTFEIGLAHHSAVLLKRSNDSLSAVLADESSQSANELKAVAGDIESHLKNLADNGNEWKVMAAGLRTEAAYIDCRRHARSEKTGLLEQRERLRVLAQETRDKIAECPQLRNGSTLLASLGESDEIANNKQFLTELLQIPLPLSYLAKHRDQFEGVHKTTPEKAIPKEPSVAKLIAFLDGLPLVAPNLVRPNIAYTLTFRISGEHWPADGVELVFDFLTTFPPALFSFSRFRMPKPKKLNSYESEINGEVIFHAPQSILADALKFEVRCAFVKQDGSILSLRTIGFTRLEFRVDDPKDTQLQSGYKLMDLHVAELVRKMVGENPNVKVELNALLPVLQAVCSVVGSYAQEGLYKGIEHVSEADFHKNVRRDLRIRLGQDLQDHPGQAGGVTDLRYKGVVIELKVENAISDRSAIAKKYCSQLTQYEAAEPRQVGVVLVLDLTPKTLPPGDIRNDILLVDVSTHGGADQQKKYPSKAFLFVINGNTRNPSSYSR